MTRAAGPRHAGARPRAAAGAPLPLTIVIPVFGRPERLARALQSIAAQEDHPAQVIVVDDGSATPVTFDAARMAGIPLAILRHERNRGPAAARNTGMGAARTQWISFLDSDDRLLPGTLGARWRLVEERHSRNPDPLAVFACGWIDEDAQGRPLATRVPRETADPRDFASGCWFSPGSCVIMNRKGVLDTGVLQDESLRRFEDSDWFLALSLRGARLRTLPLVGVAVERRRDQQPEKVERIARMIADKWRGLSDDGPLLSRLRAYLHLECAAASYFAGKRLRAAVFLLRSLLAVPRLSLQLSPGWDRKMPPPLPASAGATGIDAATIGAGIGAGTTGERRLRE